MTQCEAAAFVAVAETPRGLLSGLWRRRFAGGPIGGTPVPHQACARTRHRTVGFWCCFHPVCFVVALLIARPTPGIAQEAQPNPTPTTQKSDAPSAGSALADRQAIVRDRVSRLEDRMFQLSQALRKAEPEKAAKLLTGLGELRGRSIRHRVDEIVERLRREEFSDAADRQQAVAEDLQNLLQMLLEDPDNLDERRDEIKRLEALRKALDGVIREQQDEKTQAEASRDAERRAAALDAAAARLKNLIQRQRTLAEETSKTRAKPQALADDQAQVRQETQEVAEGVQSVLDAEAAPGDAHAKDKDSAAQDGKPAKEDGADPKQAAQNLQQAADKMKSAEQALRKNEKPQAKDHQEAAADALQRALENIEKQAEQLRNTLKLDEQSQAQRETAEKTRGLSEDMQRAGEYGGADGEKQESGGDESPKEGDQSGESGEDQPSAPTPGQQGVEQAVPLQEDAADELEDENLDEAIEKQKQALEKLDSAKEAMEDRLDQLRKEQQEELLAALESRFRAMLARQTACNKTTNRLAELGVEHWKRSDQLELAELSQKQRWVAEQADEALFILVEDGTTVVLPQLVEQVSADAREAADRLAAADAGEAVRMMQNDLEQVLRDIIDAIKKKQEELDDSGGDGGGGGNSPLLPGSAELKLLRACQLRVNKTTGRLREASQSPDVSPEDIAARLRHLSKRQTDVAQMAKDMHEALQKAQ